MEKYFIWLLLAFGEGEPEISGLIKRFGNAERAYNAFRENVALVGPELSARAEKTSLEKAEKMLDRIKNSGFGIITLDSPDYPERLRKLPDPPCLLFVQGDASLLQKKLLTSVGARAVTKATAAAIPRTVERLGKEYAVVGTLSEGCDQLICLNCIKRGVPFIEVMPCGFEHTYPTGSKALRSFLLANGGLLVTEFLPRTKSSHATFHRRSRILGGISYVTLVMQAGADSGALATAEYSSEPLFLPPNDVFVKDYVGAVSAVRSGAHLYLSEQSIEKAFARAIEKEKENSGEPVRRASYRPQKTNRSKPVKEDASEQAPSGKPAENKEESAKKALPADETDKAPESIVFESDEHRSLYEVISTRGKPVGLEELMAETGSSAETLAELLLDLEISGAIKAAGNRYTAS